MKSEKTGLKSQHKKRREEEVVLWTIGLPFAEKRAEQESFHSEAINQNDELAPGLRALASSSTFNLTVLGSEDGKGHSEK